MVCVVASVISAPGKSRPLHQSRRFCTKQVCAATRSKQSFRDSV